MTTLPAVMCQDLEVLRYARDLIADPECWTQGVYARNPDGLSVDPSDPDACCWCALGALAKAAIEIGALPGAGAGAVDILYNAAGDASTVVYVNDNDGHGAILALFDKALAREAA